MESGLKLLIDISRVSGIVVLGFGITLGCFRWLRTQRDRSSDPPRVGVGYVLMGLPLVLWLYEAEQPADPLLILGGVAIAAGLIGLGRSLGQDRPATAVVSFNLVIGALLLCLVALAYVGPIRIESPGSHIRNGAWGIGAVVALAYLVARRLCQRASSDATESDALRMV
jgi:hypothetical protein